MQFIQSKIYHLQRTSTGELFVKWVLAVFWNAQNTKVTAEYLEIFEMHCFF